MIAQETDWLQNFLNNADQAGQNRTNIMTQSEEIKPRSETCGMVMSRFNMQTGRKNFTRIACGDFRNCDKCLQRRMEHYFGEVDRLIDNGLFAMVLDKSQNGSFDYYRKKCKALYMKLPIGNGRFLAVVDSEAMCDVKKLNFQSVTSDSMKMTLEQYVAIPEGTRITGKLFHSVHWKEDEEEEYIENQIVVSASQFISNADTANLDRATLAGYAEVTKQVGIVTDMNIQQASDILIGTMKTDLMERGFYVQSQGYKNQKVSPSMIKWPLVRINRIEQVNSINSYVINSQQLVDLDSELHYLVNI